jgi:hypothetical protein
MPKNKEKIIDGRLTELGEKWIAEYGNKSLEDLLKEGYILRNPQKQGSFTFNFFTFIFYYLT